MASCLFGKQSPIPQQSNPLQALMQAMQSGQNPRDFVQQMAAHDPAWRAVNDAIGMQSPQQLRAQLDRSARGQGTNLNTLMANLARQMGLPIK